MIVVTDIGTVRVTLYEFVTANVAPCGIIIFVLFAGTEALYRPICSKNRYDLCFPHNKRVKELGERVLSDFHHGPYIKINKTRGEDGCYCTHFVLLGVGGVLHLATKRLKNVLKVCIDDERRLSTILVLVKFYLRLF